ncbi:TRAP transporter substrate-binding protein [Hirschia litorea]|uniref:TRAP transporter substrate-binding protein n=1 Tax=Hirschia litorea TaxID=1199156 RepID=A0ABW2IIP5_9PROT
MTDSKNIKHQKTGTITTNNQTNTKADTALDATRRGLLGGVGFGIAATALAACGGSNDASASDDKKAPAVIRKKRKLTMVTTWPKGLPGLYTAAERLAVRVKELTEGSLDISVFGAGELSPALQAFDDVASGAADMYHGAEYYWQSKSPAFSFFTAVPMGMTANEIMGWIDFGGGQKLWEELSNQYGVIAFQGANTGQQMGGWFRKEINTLDDFKGLKMRMPGLGGQVIRELGGSAETIAGGEIYQALQTGQIDATEWVGPWNDLALGFYQQAEYYYGPGFHEPGSSLACGMNLKVWESLTPIEQAAIRAACNEANHLSLGEFTYQNAMSLKTLTEEHAVKLRTFSPEVLTRMDEISKDVRSQAGSGGDLEKRIYESFESALAASSLWGNVADGPFLNSRSKRS